MRKQFTSYLCTLLMLALAGFAFAVMFGADRSRAEAIGTDKFKHAGVSAGLGFVARSQVADPWKAWGLAMVPGLAKEIYDARKGGTGFSVGDLIADGVGAYLGMKLGGLIFTHRSITYTRSF